VAPNEFGYVNSDWIVSKYDLMGKPLVFFPEVTLGSHLVIANKMWIHCEKNQLVSDSNMDYWEHSFIHEAEFEYLKTWQKEYVSLVT